MPAVLTPGHEAKTTFEQLNAWTVKCGEMRYFPVTASPCSGVVISDSESAARSERLSK